MARRVLMKLRFIVVGRDRRDPLVQVGADYLERIRRYVPAELVEVKETPLLRGANVARVKKDEAERLSAALNPGERVVALDEGGLALNSVALSARLDDWMQTGIRSVALVIGGPAGLDPHWVRRADECWSLSALTLPHRLARLVLLEQVYRGLTILRGEPYHK